MANLIIEMPDDLVRGLEVIAAAEQKTVEQIAVEQLRTLVEEKHPARPGSAGAVLLAMLEAPHLSASNVEELEAAITPLPPGNSTAAV